MGQDQQTLDTRSAWEVALVGALVVGFSYGMGRYAYGLTLPAVRAELDLPAWLAGSVAGGTFAGFLLALLATGPLTARRGLRAPVVLGAALGTVGALVVGISTHPVPHAAGAVATGASAGLVWAPFSDLLDRLAPARLGATLLSVVTTGTSAGLVAMGAAGAALVPAGWRWVWGATAALGAVATLLVLLVVPRHAGGGDPGSSDPGSSEGPAVPWHEDARRARGVLLYAVPYLAGVVVWFSFATEAVRDRGLPAPLGPALFVLVGVTGLAGLATGRLVQRWGPVPVGGAALGIVGAALVLLAVPTGGAPVLVASALLLGPGYMVGSALLAVWASRAVPDRPGRTFVMALVTGSVASTLAPPVVSAVATTAGLGIVLAVAAGVLCAVAAPMVLRG